MKKLSKILAILSLCSVALLVGVTAAKAGIPDDEQILVTDSNLLENMGFGPDATVYLWTKGNFTGEVADFMASQGVTTAVTSDEEGQNFTSFGGNTAWWPVSGNQFQERESDFRRGTRFGLGDIFRGAGATERFTDGQWLLPSGVDLRWIRLWGWDSNNGAGITFFLFQSCLPDFAAGGPTNLVLGSVSSAGNPGHFSVRIQVPGILNIDNQSCHYWIRARFDTTGNSLALYKARAEYARQISPAPAGATFFDVPPGHVFFRHIEALVRSGITVGCAPNLYCPNNFVTRGQMAAFLARALGLHWASF